MKLSFIVCVSDTEILAANLLQSPCLSHDSAHQLILVNDCKNAADGFNSGMSLAVGDIIVFVHQDVFLPSGWDKLFISGFIEARKQMPAEVVGVYGLSYQKAGDKPLHLGVVKDRGKWLKGTIPLPARAQSLDELLFAVPKGCNLKIDPDLGFDLYATDLVLQAEVRGGCGAVVEAPCEHRSSLPRHRIPRHIVERFKKAALAFERKWNYRFPIDTPCIRFEKFRPVTKSIDELIKKVGISD